LGNLVYFSPFWYFVPRKIWQPWSLTQFSKLLANEALTWLEQKWDASRVLWALGGSVCVEWKKSKVRIPPGTHDSLIFHVNDFADAATSTLPRCSCMFQQTFLTCVSMVCRERKKNVTLVQYKQSLRTCPGGVAQWTLHSPHELKTRVRIPPGC
jgi:hypothetical protein